jgi:anion-transporting  ArsA/GET3 family ATPase
MLTTDFLSHPRVHLVVGKGGVGRSGVTAALARVAAAAGLRALVIDIEGRSTITDYFDCPVTLDYVERRIYTDGTGGVWGRTISPDDALVDWLEDHGLRSIARRLGSSGALDIIATGVPGVRDLLVLGKIKQLERESAYDTIIVDAPASGHAVDFVATPYQLHQTAAVGPVKSQAADVMEMVGDRKRFGVLVVTIPEETPVQEALDTMKAIEERTSAHISGIIINQSTTLDELTRSAIAIVERHSTTHATGLAASVDYLVAVADRQISEIASLTAQRRIPMLQLGLANNSSLTNILDSLTRDLEAGIARW